MLADYKEDIYHCLKCGACRVSYEAFAPICPSGTKYGFDSHYAVGRVELARALLEGRLEIDSDMMRRVYSCTSCGGCDEQCNPAVGISPLRIIEEIKFEAVEKGLIPPEVRDFLKSVSIHGNPYLQPQGERGNWAADSGFEAYSSQENLYYVGCVGSYDERGRRLAKTVGDLLAAAGLSFGILGEREICDGNEVNRVGERGLFQFLAEQNISLFRELGVRKIITLSPHSYHAIRNDYVKYGGDFEVLHYTQAIQRMVHEKKIVPKKPIHKTVTFHDPCFLGRHNNEYQAPRSILECIPEMRLIEMERNRRNAFCCGGGGGNFFTDVLGSGKWSPNRIRVREAYERGADVLAVSCPNCRNMLEDGMRVEELEGKIAVRDVAEILKESCA